LGSQNYSSKLSYLLTIKHDLDKNNKQCAFTVLLSSASVLAAAAPTKTSAATNSSAAAF
jgi:hypothetical protein